VNRRHPWWAMAGLYAGVVGVAWPQYAELAAVTGFPVPITLPIGITAYLLLCVHLLVTRTGSRAVQRLATWTAAALGVFGAVAPALIGHGHTDIVAVAVATVVSILPVALLGAAVHLTSRKEVRK
jgi:putative effector of murein hydrolase LrgA (UPF0299 family)